MNSEDKTLVILLVVIAVLAAGVTVYNEVASLSYDEASEKCQLESWIRPLEYDQEIYKKCMERLGYE